MTIGDAVLTGLSALVVVFILSVALAYRSTEPASVEDSVAVLRRLEIRLYADLDKPGTRGDRYRAFECREVPRGR